MILMDAKLNSFSLFGKPLSVFNETTTTYREKGETGKISNEAVKTFSSTLYFCV